MMKRLVYLISALAALILLCSCSQPENELTQGYYTAEMSEFDVHGWKEYITIYVDNGSIISVEYNAKNRSGFIKSWDMDYMRIMDETDGTYPNEYTRTYSNALLNNQDPALVDAITGATHSHATFQLLAEAAIELARQGSDDAAYVGQPTE